MLRAACFAVLAAWGPAAGQSNPLLESIPLEEDACNDDDGACASLSLRQLRGVQAQAQEQLRADDERFWNWCDGQVTLVPTEPVCFTRNLLTRQTIYAKLVTTNASTQEGWFQFQYHSTGNASADRGCQVANFTQGDHPNVLKPWNLRMCLGYYVGGIYENHVKNFYVMWAKYCATKNTAAFRVHEVATWGFTASAIDCSSVEWESVDSDSLT